MADREQKMVTQTESDAFDEITEENQVMATIPTIDNA